MPPVSGGDFQTADDEYSQMIALRPRRVDGYLLRGISEFKAGLIENSIEDDTAALALTHSPMARADLLYNRGQAYAKRGNLIRAIADYTASNLEYAQVRDPQEIALLPDREADNDRQRAEAHWQRKDYHLAAADCGAAIAFGHPHPDDYGVRGKAESALGQDAAAQADFTQALRIDPSYLDGYIGLGNLAEKRHQYGQCVAVFQRAIQIEPSSVQFWGSLGWFQYEAGQMPQAIASDLHAQSLDPNQSWINYNLALTYAAAGMSVQAKAAYEDAMAVGSGADRKPALADLHKALAKQPGSPALTQALAQVERGPIPGERTARRRPPALAAPRNMPRAVAAFASFLGPEVTIGGYAIQPPAGYLLTQSRQESLTGSGTVYLWSGPRRADGTVPTLQAVISQDDGSLAAHMTSLQAAQATVAGMGENHTHLSSSPVTSCTLGGLPFARGDWDGVGQKTGKEYQGSEYWQVSSSWIVHLSTHDVVPYSHSTMPLLHASVLTLRKI